MSRISIFIVMIGASALAFSAQAASITVELPQLHGMITYGQSPISASFHTGVRFASIESIAVKLVGQGSEGTLRIVSPNYVRDVPFAPPLGVALPKESGVYPSGSAHASVGAWKTDFGPPTSTYLAGYFDHLLDGEGEIRLNSSDAFYTVGFDSIEIVEPSQIEITGAVITITGAPIPEPNAGILVVAAAGFYSFSRRRQFACREDHSP